MESALVTHRCVRMYVCAHAVSTYLSLCVTERGEVQRIKRRNRERQDYTHGRLEKGSEREGEDGRKKRQRGLRLQQPGPFVAEGSCDGRLMFRESLKESFSVP